MSARRASILPASVLEPPPPSTNGHTSDPRVALGLDPDEVAAAQRWVAQRLRQVEGGTLDDGGYDQGELGRAVHANFGIDVSTNTDEKAAIRRRLADLNAEHRVLTHPYAAERRVLAQQITPLEAERERLAPMALIDPTVKHRLRSLETDLTALTQQAGWLDAAASAEQRTERERAEREKAEQVAVLRADEFEARQGFDEAYAVALGRISDLAEAVLVARRQTQRGMAIRNELVRAGALPAESVLMDGLIDPHRGRWGLANRLAEALTRALRPVVGVEAQAQPEGVFQLVQMAHGEVSYPATARENAPLMPLQQQPNGSAD